MQNASSTDVTDQIEDQLAESYPGVKNLLGETCFADLVERYCQQAPVSHGTLERHADFGEFLRKALQQRADWRDRCIKADMALFEWALVQADEAPDADIVTANDVAAIDPEDWGDMSFDFHPSVNLIHLEWNVVSIWEALRESREMPRVKQAPEPQPWLIWRQGDDCHFRYLSDFEAWSLEEMLAGADFGSVCDALAQQIPEQQAMNTLAKFLKKWIDEELIEAIVFDS